jgi:hypothetical protein
MVSTDEFLNFFLTFPVILLVLGWPERLSSTDTQLALKLEYHSQSAGHLQEYSPKALLSIPMLSVTDLLSLTQNLKQTHFSILPSITKLNTK